MSTDLRVSRRSILAGIGVVVTASILRDGGPAFASGSNSAQLVAAAVSGSRCTALIVHGADLALVQFKVRGAGDLDVTGIVPIATPDGWLPHRIKYGPDGDGPRIFGSVPYVWDRRTFSRSIEEPILTREIVLGMAPWPVGAQILETIERSGETSSVFFAAPDGSLTPDLTLDLPSELKTFRYAVIQETNGDAMFSVLHGCEEDAAEGSTMSVVDRGVVLSSQVQYPHSEPESGGSLLQFAGGGLRQWKAPRPAIAPVYSATEGPAIGIEESAPGAYRLVRV